jgi:hypothetical protein
MKSSLIALFAGIVLFWSPANALADESSKNAKIEQMLELTHVDRMITQMLPQIQAMVSAQMAKTDLPPDARQRAEEVEQKIMAIVADRMSWEKARPAYIKIYAETFSESDIDGILAFYKSPAGQAMLEKMPQLMRKSMDVSQQLMGDVMPQIQQMMTEQMKQSSLSNDKK